MKAERGANFFLLLILVLIGAGFVRLFHIRFDEGDIYPPYSSLRSDPLGVRLLAESLDSLEGREVVQNMSALYDAEFPEMSTLVRLGVDSTRRWLPTSEVDEIQRYLISGGRLVMAMQPVASVEIEEPVEGEVCKKCGKVHNPSGKKTTDTGKTETPEEDEKEEKRTARSTDIYEKWGVSIGSVQKADTTPQDRLSKLTSPWDLPYDSWLKFEPTHEAWRVLHRFGQDAVVIERDYGRGSIVLVGSSYPFSNEAMLFPSHLASLMTIFGDSKTLVFDESHLGVQRKIGLMDLIYKYGLEGVLTTLAFIAGLYLWRSFFPLIPPYSDARIDQDFGRGRFDAVTGLTQLMRRHLPMRQTASTMLDLYRQAHRGRSQQKTFQNTWTRMKALSEEPEMTRRKNTLSTIQKLHRMANEKPGG